MRLRWFCSYPPHMSDGAQASRSPAQERQLREAARAVRPGCPLPWDVGPHRARCRVCAHPDLAEIELRFLNWEPVAQLARVYSVSIAQLESHAACFLLHLRRCGELAPAYSRLVAAGLDAAEKGSATPEHALRALQALAPKG